MGPMKPWSAMGREGRRGREPFGAPWSGKGGGGGEGEAGGHALGPFKVMEPWEEE